jgi:hypothetical protein
MLKASAESLSRRFQKSLGYRPDLENPKTLQEKILWRKLYEDMSEAVQLADKVAARDYVREVAGEKYLIEAYQIVADADDIDFGVLPRSFVLKNNRASGTNMIIHDKVTLDTDSIRRILNSMLRFEYGRRLGEHWYAAMPPRVIVERLLVDQETVIPVDYRFHVFHGKAEFVQVMSAKRFSEDMLPNVASVGQKYVDSHDSVVANYTLDWQPAPFRFRTRTGPVPLIRKPGAADDMVAVAEKLAGGWGYVRVDLYCIDDKDVYFSEMTFAPNAGLFGFVPESYNEFFGNLWDIRRRYVRTERALNPHRDGSQDRPC